MRFHVHAAPKVLFVSVRRLEDVLWLKATVGFTPPISTGFFSYTVEKKYEKHVMSLVFREQRLILFFCTSGA